MRGQAESTYEEQGQFTPSEMTDEHTALSDPPGDPAIGNPASHEHNRLALLRQIGRDILSERSLRATADTALAYLFDALPIHEVYVVLYDEDFDSMYGLITSWPGFENPYRELLADHRDLHTRLLAERTIIVPNVPAAVEEMPTFRNLADLCTSLMVIGLQVRDEYIGALVLTTLDRYEFTAEDIELVREVADWLAIAVRQNNLLEQEQSLRRQQETLREVAASITAGLDRDVVLRRILDQLGRVLPSVSSGLFLRLPNDRFELAAYRGLRSDWSEINRLHELPPPHFSMILADRQAIVLGDTHKDPDWITIPGGEYIRSWLGVPLVVEDRVIGILTLDRDEPGMFSPVDVQLVTVFADQAAIAIENARLFEEELRYAERLAREVRERTSELEALYAMSAVTGSALDLETVLARSLAMAMPAFGATAGAIHLLDEDNVLRLAAAIPADASNLCWAHCQEVADDHPVYRKVLEAGDGWLATIDELRAMGFDGNIANYVGAPMRSHGRTIGVVNLLDGDPQLVQPATLPLLSAISDRVAIAVENVQLRLRTRQTAVLEERERLAMELHDSVTQALYGILLFAEAARDAASTGNHDALLDNLASTQEVAHQAMGEMRLLLYDLRSEALARLGLAEALEQRLEAVERRAGLNAHLALEGPVETLPAAIEEALYRVAQEALSNALRHAQATEVSVFLRSGPDDVELQVADNGLGLDLEQLENHPGQGLLNMQRRMTDIGGWMQISKRPSGGTNVHLWAPLHLSPDGG